MRAFTIKSSDIGRCPSRRLGPGHYRADGTCRCVTPDPERTDWCRRCDTTTEWDGETCCQCGRRWGHPDECPTADCAGCREASEQGQAAG